MQEILVVSGERLNDNRGILAIVNVDAHGSQVFVQGMHTVQVHAYVSFLGTSCGLKSCSQIHLHYLCFPLELSTDDVPHLGHGILVYHSMHNAVGQGA